MNFDMNDGKTLLLFCAIYFEWIWQGWIHLKPQYSWSPFLPSQLDVFIPWDMVCENNQLCDILIISCISCWTSDHFGSRAEERKGVGYKMLPKVCILGTLRYPLLNELCCCMCLPWLYPGYLNWCCVVTILRE